MNAYKAGFVGNGKALHVSSMTGSAFCFDSRVLNNRVIYSPRATAETSRQALLLAVEKTGAKACGVCEKRVAA